LDGTKTWHAPVIKMQTIEKECPFDPLFVTVKQASVLLKVSQKSIYRLLDRGLLKASPALRHKRITVSSINAFAATANN